MPPLGEPTVEDPDITLLERCGRKDHAAFAALYDRHHTSVFRFLSRLSHTHERDLDDLVQATFLEVYRSANGFRGHSTMKTWLFGIAVNVARHHARAEGRRRGFLRVVEQLEQGTAELSVDHARLPDEQLERRQALTRVQAAIDSLPIELREPFVACELEELPGAEVARLLGIPEGTLWRRLHDARKVIHQAMQPRGARATT